MSYIIAGIGTNVGKSVVSAILTTCLHADYWKPIQCGKKKRADTAIMHTLIDTKKHAIHTPAYSFKNALSPHHAARLEHVEIDSTKITLPDTKRPLIIESVGGIFAPLTTRMTTYDLFHSWNIPWIIVSKHYIGSINHTLLTVDALQRRGVSIAGLIFNGCPNTDSESAILHMTHLPLLARLLPEKKINQQTIQRYAQKWQKIL